MTLGTEMARVIGSFFLRGEHGASTPVTAKIGPQGSAAVLPSACTATMMKPSLCFFPQYIVQTVETPLFIVMSSFDQVQISYNLSPEHESCLLNKNCTLDELAMI
ncbi:unnamed protein product [Cuscuta campestris]|uniref:Pectin acetylesterase n=1 Tax=Cuscuta campestris TaxID=132261 RepID=A0A484N7J6_9ASTE|nr:unnamed protein product [Cuscuta campestris]